MTSPNENVSNSIPNETPQKEDNMIDDEVVFFSLNITALKIPFLLLTTYKDYVNLLWETNLNFGDYGLTEENVILLKKVRLDVVSCLDAELSTFILFIINRNLFTEDVNKMVRKIGDIPFAVRIRDCMYSDHSLL